MADKFKKCIVCGKDVHPYRLLNTGLWGMICHNENCILHTIEPSYKSREELLKDWNNGRYKGVSKCLK